MGLNLDWAPEPDLCAECRERDVAEGQTRCAVCLSWDLPHPDAYVRPRYYRHGRPNPHTSYRDVEGE